MQQIYILHKTWEPKIHPDVGEDAWNVGEDEWNVGEDAWNVDEDAWNVK